MRLRGDPARRGPAHRGVILSERRRRRGANIGTHTIYGDYLHTNTHWTRPE